MVRGRRRKYRSIKGFTLLELLLVLAMLATLVAVQLPRLTGLSSQSTLRSQAKVLRMVMLTARAQAVQQRRALRLHLEPNGYRLDVQADPVNAPRDFIPLEEGPLARRYEIPHSISLTVEPELAFIRFTPDGINEDALIKLTDTDGAVVTLELEANSHRIAVMYGDGNV